MESRDKYQVLFYETINSNCPAEEFLGARPVKVRAKIAKWIEKLEEYGSNLPRPYTDIIRGKIRELRVIFSSAQYRLLYFFCDKHIVITHGFIKKSDKVPESEIKRAENLMFDFEDRVKKGDIEL